MAAIHVKSDERRAQEEYVLNSFQKGGGSTTSADREAAEVIAARSREAYNSLRKMEGKKNG